MELKQLKAREEMRAKNKALIKSGRLVIKTEQEAYPSGVLHEAVNAYMDGVKIISWGFMPKDMTSTFDFEGYATQEKERKELQANREKRTLAKVLEIKREASKMGYTANYDGYNDTITITNAKGQCLTTVWEIIQKSVLDVMMEAEAEQDAINNYEESKKMIEKALTDGFISSIIEHDGEIAITDMHGRLIYIDNDTMRRNAKRLDLVPRYIEKADKEERAASDWKQADELQAIELRRLGLKATFNGINWTIKYRNSVLYTGTHLTMVTSGTYINAKVSDFTTNYQISQIIEQTK